MLQRDLITRNIEILVQLAMKALGLYVEDPNEAMKLVEQKLDLKLIENLLIKDNAIEAENPLMVKVNVDLYYVRALSLFQLKDKEAKTALETSIQLMQNYMQLFPSNFPFDYYKKIEIVQNKINSLT